MKTAITALNLLLVHSVSAGSPKWCLYDLEAPPSYSFPCFNLITDDPKVLEWARDFKVYDAWNPNYCAPLYEADFVPGRKINELGDLYEGQLDKET